MQKQFIPSTEKGDIWNKISLCACRKGQMSSGTDQKSVSIGSCQSIRPSRPNPLKLSEFVEFFAFIILVINFLEFASIFIKIQVKYVFGFFAFFAKKTHFHRKIDDNSTLVDQILKAITYSDSSWKLHKNLKTFHEILEGHLLHYRRHRQ